MSHIESGLNIVRRLSMVRELNGKWVVYGNRVEC